MLFSSFFICGPLVWRGCFAHPDVSHMHMLEGRVAVGWRSPGRGSLKLLLAVFCLARVMGAVICVRLVQVGLKCARTPCI